MLANHCVRWAHLGVELPGVRAGGHQSNLQAPAGIVAPRFRTTMSSSSIGEPSRFLWPAGLSNTPAPRGAVISGRIPARSRFAAGDAPTWAVFPDSASGRGEGLATADSRFCGRHAYFDGRRGGETGLGRYDGALGLQWQLDSLFQRGTRPHRGLGGIRNGQLLRRYGRPGTDYAVGDFPRTSRVHGSK